MRSNGLATILLMVPVLTVPALAIFGIPQFAPVVASPLDEGLNNDRESGVGNSARPSHDEFFGDVDGFGSDSVVSEESKPKRSKSAASGAANRRESIRSSKDPDVSTWNDDLAMGSNASNSKQPRRGSLPPDSDETGDSNSISGRGGKRSMAAEKLSRERERKERTTKNDDLIVVASAADLDRAVVQAGFEDENDSENSQSGPSGTRSRSNISSKTHHRESSGERLTWANAVERLNQLDIRSFRIEPGHQQGQYIFVCSYTPPDSPRVSYRYEAEADEPLKAVEKVINQIIERQQPR